jgi:hypothetical protein
MALHVHTNDQAAWCSTAYSRDPASRTLTVVLINLVMVIGFLFLRSYSMKIITMRCDAIHATVRVSEYID